MAIRIIDKDEVLTHYFDESKETGFKYRRATAFQRAEWTNKATKIKGENARKGFRPNRAGVDVNYDTNEFNRLLWEECIVEIFGFIGKEDKALIYSKDLYVAIPTDIFEEMAAQVLSSEVSSQNGAASDPLS